MSADSLRPYHGSERGAILLAVALGKPAGAKSARVIFYFPGPPRLPDGTFRPGQQQIVIRSTPSVPMPAGGMIVLFLGFDYCDQGFVQMPLKF
jgi:hypothetical protein